MNWHYVSLVVARDERVKGPLPITVVPSKGGPCVTGRASWEALATASAIRFPDPPPPPPTERQAARLRQALVTATVDEDVDPEGLRGLEAWEQAVRDVIAARNRREGGHVLRARL